MHFTFVNLNIICFFFSKFVFYFLSVFDILISALFSLEYNSFCSLDRKQWMGKFNFFLRMSFFFCYGGGQQNVSTCLTRGQRVYIFFYGKKGGRLCLVWEAFYVKNTSKRIRPENVLKTIADESFVLQYIL